ncbi:MAG: hypothetical protein WD823_07690 [Sulfuricaulis sp.]|uniref:pilus assembly protein n=1 Tax=Sulfuricaulis sp. TaxID=2003553 RepID=UPI0034A38FDA
MTTDLHSIKRIFRALLAGALVALSGVQPVNAKDTDIYLLAPTTSTDDKPNIMIILDNSGSMNTTISSTRPPYDPAIDYCTGDLDTLTGVAGANGGKPSNCSSIGGRIYWSFNASPPSMSSSQWFTDTKNECLASLDPASGLAASGRFAGTKIARWHGLGSTANRNWKTLSGKTDSNITFVDCQADGTTDGQTAGDNTFPRDSTSIAYTSTSSQAFNWNGFTSSASPTLFTANYMNYWHNSALLVTLTRMDVAKAAVKNLIDANISVRFGLMAFNNNNQTPHGGRVLMRIDNMDNARRTAMKNIVDSLSPDTFTPLAETLWEAYRYFAGLSVTYGNPSPEQTPHQDSCAQNTSNAACDNGGYYDAIAAGLPAYNDGTYISPYKFGCQAAYIIYVTDGDPTNDTDANGSSRITGLAGLSVCDGSSCLDDLAGWMRNNDVYSGLPSPQVVKTYTIGFGTGISAAGLALLQDTATEGGGTYFPAEDSDKLSIALQSAINEITEVDTSFSAPSLSVNAFNRLFNRDDIYFALFNPSSTQAWDGNLKKFRLCNSSDVTAFGCVFGEVIDVNNVAAIDTSIDPTTGKPRNKIKDTSVSYWGSTADGSDVTKGGAGAKITDNTKVPRTLHTYRGSYSGLTASSPATPVTIVATSGNSVYDVAINDPTILGLTDTSGSPSTTNAADTAEVATLIKWMRGQDAYDDDADGNTDESRVWNFADPLHSRPVAFSFGAELSAGVPDPNKPVIKLIVGTNDGLVRIINNSTGVEEWAFIPNELLKYQRDLSQNNNGDHIYGMDDSPAFLVIDIDHDGMIEPADGDRVYMFIGMRRGVVDPATNRGNIYAFDLTPAATMTLQTDTVTPKLIWVIQGGVGNYAQLGQTWSRPLVARIRAKCSPPSACDDGDPATNDSESRMALIFGGGYDINQDNNIPAGTDLMGNAIYIADPFTGQRLWWASSDTGAALVLPKMQFSIPSEVTALDTNGDKSVDRLYVGDTGGQLWRIDLGDQIGAVSDGSSGYMFADIGCDSTSTTQRVHDAAGACPVGATIQGMRKFFYPPDVAQVKDGLYSSNENYDLVAIGSGDREDPLDLLTSKPTADFPVHNRIYAFRDYDYRSGAPTTTPTTPITEFVMYDATADNLGTLTGAALQNEIDTKVKNSKGWFIDLVEPSNVTLLNGLSSTWAGEKVLAKPIIFDGVLFVTTFFPANQNTVTSACLPNEGEARTYALKYLTGEANYDLDNDGSIERFAVVGGGIPSEVVIVIRDGGVTGLVGTSGGAGAVSVGGSPPRYKTFWWDE